METPSSIDKEGGGGNEAENCIGLGLFGKLALNIKIASYQKCVIRRDKLKQAKTCQNIPKATEAY